MIWQKSTERTDVASLVNAAPRILKVPLGLVLMTDLGVPSYA